jgi:hypothetical protein
MHAQAPFNQTLSKGRARDGHRYIFVVYSDEKERKRGWGDDERHILHNRETIGAGMCGTRQDHSTAEEPRKLWQQAINVKSKTIGTQ